MQPTDSVQLARVAESIAAPTAAIWEILTDFAHPQRLAPTIDRCTVEGDGVGAVRFIESSRGLRIHERLLECDTDAGRYRYEVLASGDMPFAHISSYECTVTLTPLADGRTGIDWCSIGTIDGPPEPIEAFLRMLYERATQAIRGELVPR